MMDHSKKPNLWPRAHFIIEIISQEQNPILTDRILKGMLTKGVSVAEVTLRRDLSKLVNLSILQRSGQGRATKYSISSSYKLMVPIDEQAYLEVEIDHRNCLETFNFEIFEQLTQTSIFSKDEQENFESMEREFHKNIEKLSSTIIKKEFERLTIELSWKSSAIEGNTYDLLETETLLREGVKASGKTDEEAQMILNHKSALTFIRENQDTSQEISVPFLEKLHSILVENLNVSKNIRKRLVGITGTKYKPLDNEFQIREALERTCTLINKKDNIFEKSFLALILISYIQPFEDGNKRASRLLANSLLISNNAFPLSFRSIDINDYKKATLLFYEKNYLLALKRLFIEQAHFSNKNYFRITSSD